MKLRHLLFILMIDLVMGSNPVITKLVVAEVAPVTAAFLRFILVFLACSPWLRWVPGRMGMVALTSLVAGAFFLAVTHISFSVADNVSALAIAGQLGVPFSVIFAMIFFRERVAWIRGMGIVLSLVGIAIVGFDPAIADERLGLLLTILGTLLWAAGSLMFRKLAGVPPLTIYAWLALISLPVLGLLSLLFEPGEIARVGSVPPATWGWIAFSALGTTVLGHGGMAWMLQRYPVSVISPLTLPAPLFAVVSAVIVFETPVTAQMVIGGLLTLAGVAIITIRSARKREIEKLA